MATFAKGSYCFVPDDDDVFVAAKVSSTFQAGKPGQVSLLKSKHNMKLSGEDTKGVLPMDEQSLKPMEDMVQMKRLDNASILHNLRLRFAKNEIYTNIGTILVAVNPFKQLPIYGPSIMDEYMNKGARGLSPHIYGVADNAYRAMTSFYRDQACIVSGESGAGKTETTKLFLQYIAEKSGGSASQNDGTPLQERILEANPIMEAFGNAKTVRNDNSSRFGKWINVSFNNKNGTIVAGNITQYLLEKSRVVHQAEKERNYHIFYQLCLAGQIDPEIKKKFKLLEADEYYYLNQSEKASFTKVDSIDDKADWESTLQAMTVLGLSEDQKDDVIRLVSGILHLGNISFEGGDKAKVKNKEALGGAAKLFGTDAGSLETALCKRSLAMGRESVMADNDASKAADSRDALSKAVYSYLFDWLITKINTSLSKTKVKVKDSDLTRIGVLDIFGFESFDHNSFEQLCINYCNEKLQGHFNEHIFRLEQKEYAAEGIDVSKIDFVDNSNVIACLDTKGTGIFSMIDEEINLPKGSDEGFLKKTLDKADNKTLKKPDMKLMRTKPELRSCFVVHHYAGEVSYDSLGFLEKNKDTLVEDLSNIGLKSKVSFIKSLFEAQAKLAGGGGNGRKSNKKTLGFQFKSQLNDLMGTLNKTEPHFVRCVKPNQEKEGGIFTAKMVMDQLNYAGLLEVCRIRQNGYPVRKEFKDFIKRYRPLDPKSAKDVKSLCASLQKKKVLKKNEYQIGKKKVFMRTEQFNDLEAKREKSLGNVAIMIQKVVRGFVQRRKYKRYKKILKDIEVAIKDKNESKLEKALLSSGQLPHNGNGKAMKSVEKGRELLAKLREERRLLKLLEDAIKSRDESAIKSALDAAQAAKVKDKAIGQAEKLLKKIGSEKECKKELQAAIKSKDLKKLKAAIAHAKKIDALDSPDAKDAQTLADRLEKTDKTAKSLDDAVKKKNIAEIKKLMTVMVELGAKDHPSVLKGQEIAKEEAKASEERTKEMKKLEKKLKEATEKSDLVALRELEAKVIEYGMEGKVVDKAIKMRKKLEDSQDTASKLAATRNTLAVKARSHDGIVKADIKPLTKAIAEAKKEGMKSDDEELKAAVEFEKKMNKQLSVQQQLKDALEKKKYDVMKAAMIKSNELGLETGDAQKVSAWVREHDAEEAEKNKESAAAQREANRKKLKEGSKEDLDKQAMDRLARLSSSTHIKRIKQASDNSRYDLAKYYKIRTDEDFTEFDPPAFKKQRATLKLWSRTKPIPKSILELDSDLNKVAIRINRAVLQYCGDLSTSFPATLAHYILVSGLETPSVCDEIYIQLCKHVRGNTRKESADRGWLLMCMCTKTFPPSQEFSPYLINYLINRKAAPGLIGNYARLSLLQLDATLELGPTWFKPNIDEIKCYRKRPPILATIERVDGTAEDFPVTPDLRVAQVLEMCRRSAKIKDDPERPTWGIYVKDNDQQEELEPRERLIRFYKKYNPAKLVHVDLFLESWKGNEVELFEKLVEKYGPEPTSREEKLLQSKQKSKNMLSLPVTAAKSAAKRLGLASETRAPPPSPQSPWPLPWWVHLGDVYLRMSNQNKDPRFVFKRRLFSPKTEEDSWLQMQLRDDFSNGELVVKGQSQAVELAALGMAIDNKGKLPKDSEVTNLLPSYIAPKYLDKKNNKDLVKSIKGVKLASGVDAQRKKYISLGKKSPVYGMCFFYVCRQDSDNEYVCGVDHKGVHILNMKKDQTIRTFSYKSIRKFGSTSEFLWMNVVEDGKSDKGGFSLVKNSQGMNVILYTLQSWEMYDLIYDYTHMS